MTSLAARVLRSVRARALVSAGDRIVVAVSGGADSVALVHLLLEIAPSLDAAVVGIAHLHHGLRGSDADADQAFVGALAAGLALQFHASSRDVGALARDRGISVEQAGHEARRAFYAWAIAASGASVLATGHTADDQAETVLLRLIRGAGTRGLGGIHPRHGRVVRPLIDMTRAELRRYLAARHVAWREDATNDDPAIVRNRVRRELVPLLRERFSPAVVGALARAADVLRDDEAYLEVAATAAAASVVLQGDGSVMLDRERLARLHPALARRVVRQAIRAVGRGGSVGARHVDSVLELVQGPGREAQVLLPEASATVSAGRITVRERREAGRPARAGRDPMPAPIELVVPGDTDVPGMGLQFTATTLAGSAAESAASLGQTPDMVVLDAGAATGGLFVRTRRPGDRLRPMGLAGRKKLQDLFVDRGVPRAERDRVAVVVDAHDAVVWVVGHAVSEAAVPRPPVSSVLLLKVKRFGG
jgi:tRNA(Ile)-lysidine synthase